MKKLLSLVIIVVGIVADQIFKNWIVANIQLGDTEKIWPNVLSLTYIKNDGAAWSSFSGQQWFFLVLTPIVLVVALWFLWKKMAWHIASYEVFLAETLHNIATSVSRNDKRSPLPYAPNASVLAAPPKSRSKSCLPSPRNLPCAALRHSRSQTGAHGRIARTAFPFPSGR